METTSVSQSASPESTTSNNGRLPFDVLGLIFHQYSLESIYPKLIKLESLLLVCKSWASAALGHKALWARFDIELSSTESVGYWKVHAPLRVSRTSPTCLIDVQIFISPKDDLLNHEIEEAIRGIVRDLTGSEGHVAKRWRSLFLIGTFVHPEFMEPFLSFPTPNLIDLKIHNLMCEGRLPETPVLDRFQIHHSNVPYPDLQNVTELDIWAEAPEEFDEEAVSNARRLTKLTVEGYGAGCRLRGEFPLLEYLCTEVIEAADLFISFSAPGLKTLSLCYPHPLQHLYPSQYAGIPFQTLEKLQIKSRFQFNEVDEDDDYLNGVRLVLTAAVNIDVLQLHDEGAVEIVLMLLKDLSKFLDHHFILRYFDCTMQLCQGQARLDRVAAFRSEATLEKGLETEDEEGLCGSDCEAGVEFDDD